tara:strand:+ start:76 stop:255 length:180 start_codon:yes stop_codon:yes gene_type:complete
MPFMKIYKATDNQWHQRDCKKLSEKKITEEKVIGSIGDPDPPKNEMCATCFGFLFKEKA